MNLRIFAAALAAFVSTTPVFAADYCWIEGGRARLVNGGTVVHRGRTVVSSVPRPAVPGKPLDRPWCVQERNSLGGHSSNRVI